MKKWIYILIFVLLLNTFIVLANDEAQIVCGGNSEVQISCLGDEELSFWGNLPITSISGSGGGGLIKPIQTTIFRKMHYNYIIFIIIPLILFFIFLFKIIKKKPKSNKYENKIKT